MIIHDFSQNFTIFHEISRCFTKFHDFSLLMPVDCQCSRGHGRAADVWSLGCVVVEMSTGRRPWPELDSSAQIMFKVGMGQSPSMPPSLSKEGHDFLMQCFVHDPTERASAVRLLHHPFVKVSTSAH